MLTVPALPDAGVWGGRHVEAVLRLARLLERPGGRFDLFHAALCLPGIEGPMPDVTACAREVDRLAHGLSSVAELRARLFGELGFAGDTDEYDAPRNSFLPQVIARRRGLPITLSLLTAEVARHARLDVRIIGMPGHVLALDGGTGEYFDPFHGGRTLTLAECEARFRETTGAGPEVAFGPDRLPELEPAQVLTRMLDNLIRSYRVRQRHRELELALRMRRMLPGFGMDDLLALGEAIAAQARLN